jgi:hypothetical protein
MEELELKEYRIGGGGESGRRGQREMVGQKLSSLK